MPPKAAAVKRAGVKADAPKIGKKAKKEPEPEPEEEEEEDSEDGNDDDEDETDQKPEVRKSSSKVETKPSAKDSGASILRKNDKNNMAYPKGTYLIRLADLDTEKKDHIWRVDNHQLLQKYERQVATTPRQLQVPTYESLHGVFLQ